VAFTRARERLLLTYAASRMSFGSPATNPSSRFIAEIPEELIEKSSLGSRGLDSIGGWEKRGDRHGISGHGTLRESEPGSLSFGGVGSSGRGGSKEKLPVFEAGETLSHKLWGKGTVLSVSGDALEVNFAESVGRKRIINGLAPIVKLSS
jgi:DNA helicase-2/ATP-dependent DNA helicase PcrA